MKETAIVFLLASVMAGNAFATLSITPTEAVFGPEGGYGTISTIGDGSWSALVDYSTGYDKALKTWWTHVTPSSSGSAGFPIVYLVDENSSVFPRETVITVNPGSLKHVIRQAGYAMKLSCTNLEFKAEGGNATIQVTLKTGVPLDVAADQDWISIAVEESDMGRQIDVRIARFQTARARREGSIRIGNEVVSIKQRGPIVNVSPQILSCPAEGGKMSFEVDPEGEYPKDNKFAVWSMSSVDDWIEVLGDDIRMFGSPASVSLKPNLTGGERVGTVKVVRPNSAPPFDQDYTVVTFIQPPCMPVENLNVSPSVLDVSAQAARRAIQISAPANLKWHALNSSDWLSFPEGGQGMGSQSFIVACSNNVNVWQRTGVVSVQALVESLEPNLDVSSGVEVDIMDMENVEGNEGRGMTYSLSREFDGTFCNALTGTPFRTSDSSAFSISFSFKVKELGRTNSLASLGNKLGLYLDSANRLCINLQVDKLTLVQKETDFFAYWANVEYAVLLRQDAQGEVAVFATQKNDQLTKVCTFVWDSVLPFDKGQVEASAVVLGKTCDSSTGYFKGVISDLRIWQRALNDRECECADLMRRSVCDVMPRGMPGDVSCHYFPLDGNMIGTADGSYFCKGCRKEPNSEQKEFKYMNRFGVSNRAVRAEHRYVFPEFSEFFGGQATINDDREWPDGGICVGPERRYGPSSAGGTGFGWGYFCKHGYNAEDYFPYPAVAYGECETDASYSLWMRVDSFPTEDQEQVPILVRTRPTSDNRGVVVDAANGSISLDLLPSGHLKISGSGISEKTSTQALVCGQWSQIVIVGRSENTVSLFVNGKKWIEVPSTMTLGYLPPVDRRCYCYGSDTPEHGAIEYATLSVGGWVGAVDDVSFYHAALTDAQVVEAYEKNRPSGGQIVVNQSATAVAVNPTSIDVDVAGRIRAIEVATGDTVRWEARSDAAWVTIEQGSVSTGSCNVVVSIEANASAVGRTAHLMVAGRTVLIEQRGHGATISLDVLSFDAGSSGQAITVIADDGVTWTATSDSSWLVVSVGATGNGTGPVVVVTERNYSASARTAILTIAGKQVEVTQQPADVVVDPRTFMCDYIATTLKPSVSAASGESWSATSGANWLTLTGATSGTGNGEIVIAVAKNNTGADRVGMVTVNGAIPIVITQLVTRALSGITVTGQGHVSGSLPYKCGEKQTLRAVPATGYVFDHWVYNGKSISGVTLPVSSEDYQSLTAVFTRQKVDGFSTSNAFYSCNLVWKPRIWATSYKVYRSDSKQMPQQPIDVLTAEMNCFSDTNGVSGTTYYYWIEAVAKDGTSSITGPITGLRKHIRTDTLDIDGPAVVYAGEKWEFMGGCVWTDGITMGWGSDNFTSVSWSIAPSQLTGITFYKSYEVGWYSVFKVSEDAPEQTCTVRFSATGTAASGLGVRSVEKQVHVLPVRKVNGPGTASFDMRMEQLEGYQGYFQVLKDGAVIGTIGSGSFERMSFDILDGGAHVFSWKSVQWPGHVGGRIRSSYGVMANYVWTPAPASVTLTFNPTGGSCALSSKRFTPGQTLGELPVPSRAGYTFKCWSTSQAEADSVTESTYVPLRDTVLYAIWEVKCFDVTFELGAHAHRIGGGALKQSVEYGSSAVPPEIVIDDGYVFWGWSCPVDDITADLTVYLTVARESCVVQFDPNGGEGVMADLALSNDLEVAIAPSTFVRRGYVFVGWSDSEKGDVILHDGDIVSNMTFTAEVVRLYAQWEAILYDVNYFNTKGAANSNPATYTIENGVVFSPLGNIANFTFAGWTPPSIPVGSTGDKVVTANWTWVPQDATVEASITGGKELKIEAAWVTTELEQRFGAGKAEEFRAKYGADLSDALMKKTGKVDGSGNELSVWHDYVAGTDPTDPESVFKARITMVNGLPVIEWDPNLNENGEERVYTVYGKEDLKDAWHSPKTDADRFFKVDVAMPEDGTVTFNVGGGSSVDPIVIRVGNPIGVLPTPTRQGYDFLGWFTEEKGGTAITPETIVTADMMIYAHWEKKVAADLVHRWSFNGDLTDSVGGQTATTVGNVTTDGSQYKTPGGSSGSAYIDLGNWILPTNGLPVTIEMWVTQDASVSYGRIFCWGAMPTEGTFSPYDTTKYAIDPLQMRWDGACAAAPEISLNSFAVGTEYHVAAVLEPTAGGAWRVTYYKQNASTGVTLSSESGTMKSGWTLQGLKQTDMVLGQTLTTWDFCSKNSYNELRVWKKAMTEAELTASAKAGPNAEL